ncbi:hypothetical protein ACLB2K_075197 [Fragaria x ananassa]
MVKFVDTTLFFSQGYSLASQLGHSIVPSLFTFKNEDPQPADLSGSQYKDEFVTAGGVPLSENAWSGGYIAGTSIGKQAVSAQLDEANSGGLSTVLVVPEISELTEDAIARSNHISHDGGRLKSISSLSKRDMVDAVAKNRAIPDF